MSWTNSKSLALTFRDRFTSLTAHRIVSVRALSCIPWRGLMCSAASDSQRPAMVLSAPFMERVTLMRSLNCPSCDVGGDDKTLAEIPFRPERLRECNTTVSPNENGRHLCCASHRYCTSLSNFTSTRRTGVWVSGEVMGFKRKSHLALTYENRLRLSVERCIGTHARSHGTHSSA